MTCKGLFTALAVVFLAVSVRAQTVAPADGGDREKSNKTEASGVTFAWKEHPSLRFGDTVRVDLRARIAAIARGSEVPFEDQTSELDLPRRRFGVDGRVGNLLDFQVERELTGDDPWRDVYVNLRRYRALEVQAGQFKLPFSLDETTSPANLDFVYRSTVANILAPGRDSGVMAHGQLLSRRLSYEAGLFKHDGDHSFSRSHPDRVAGGQTTAMRVRVQPWRTATSLWKELTVGAAFTGSKVPDGIMAVHGKTPLDQSFFPANFWVNGRRTRAGVEVHWHGGPASIASEYIRFANQRSGESIRGENLPSLVASGWYVSGVWTLVRPPYSEPAGFELVPRHVGKIDAVVRLEQLAFGSANGGDVPSTSPRAEAILHNSDTTVTFGMNWYITRWFSLRANLIHDSILHPELAPDPTRPSYWSQAVRFEFAL